MAKTVESSDSMINERLIRLLGPKNTFIKLAIKIMERFKTNKKDHRIN
jgi:hypothetical protein